MIKKEVIKERVCAAIDEKANDIISLAEDIAKEPELGFKEVRTATKVAEAFKRMSVPYESGLAITGVKARLAGRNALRTVGVLGELDAVICHDHPLADKATGAAHACGHHAQVAAMIGCGIGLLDAKAMDELDGDVVLFAVPAEEYVEIEYRNSLRQEGKLKYLGGKQELIYRGSFDDIDMAMLTHLAAAVDGKRVLTVGGTGNGFIGKMVRYTGREAHAGGRPHMGINALNAAMLSMMAMHVQRETFKDEDCVRVHPILTKGGDLVNVIPADVRMESYVRARTVEAMIDANMKVNRAITAGASAVGAGVEICDLPGYLPLMHDDAMTKLFKENACSLVGDDAVIELGHNAGSTDMGDLAHIKPIIHPRAGGVAGTPHSREFMVVDPIMAYIIPAKCMALTVIDLLYDGAQQANSILKSFSPKLTQDSYITLMDSIAKTTKIDF